MSAVILAVIVVMWAVVLVPMWLRRHDAATESRSVDRFSTAMRVLSRRNGGGPDRRYVLMPKRESAAAVHVSGASAHARRRPAPRPATAAPPARPKVRPSLAVRRRRTLLGLLGLTLLTFVLMLTGVMSWPLQFVLDLVLVAFIVHLRTQAKRTAAASRRRRRVAAASAPARPAPQRAPEPVFTPAPTYAAEATYADLHYEPFEEFEPQLAAEATGTDEASGGAWQPVPVPPPTYTMKPKAPPRRYYAPPAAPVDPADDRSAFDETGPIERVVDEPEPGEQERSELDGILEHRWAVND